jgi:hypothetical protein
VSRGAVAVLVTAFALAACGGTPNTPDGSFVNSPGGSSSPPPSLVKASLTVTVPLSGASSRRARYVSPKTGSIVIALASVNGSGVSNGTATTLDIGPRAPGCKASATSTTCKGSVDATPGDDVFNVTTFAGPQASGPVLSVGQVSSTISGSSGNVGVSPLSLTLSGIVATMKLVITPATAKLGTPGRSQVLVTAYDAAGAAIVGPSDYSTPVTLEVQGDGVHAYSLRSGTSSGSSVALPKPSQTVSLLYDGSTSATSISLLASVPGTGNPSATASFTLRGIPPPPQGGDIYVLNAGANAGLGATVTVYDGNAKGNAAPKRTISLNANLYAQTVALDAKQNLYVGYFDSPAGASAADGSPDAGNEIAIFAPNASGSATPSAIISADPRTKSSIFPAAIAFDAQGELVTYGASTVDDNGGNATLVYAPGASGAAAPVDAWAFASPYYFYPGPVSIAIDASGNFYIAGTLKTSLAPQSGVYVASAADRANPSVNAARTIPWDTGTGLTPGEAGDIGLDQTGEVYVANFTRLTTGGCQAAVNVFAAGATGGVTDIPPLRIATIPGFVTTNTTCEQPGNVLAAHFPAIAVFGSFVYASDDFNNAIALYPIASSGTVTPARTIGGAATGLNAPISLAVGTAGQSKVSARETHARFSSQDAPR